MILGYFSYDLGIDLGTSNTLIAVKDRGVVLDQPSVIAITKKGKNIVAVGEGAKEMLGKSPDNIDVISPLVDGVISDLDAAQKMLSFFIKQVHSSSKEGLPKIPRPHAVISIPYGVTEVERRAVVKVAKGAGCRKVDLVEKPVAAAVGLGLNVTTASGNLIVDIGGGSTEIAVVSLGGIVVGNSLKVGGIKMDEAIINYVKNRFSVLLGEVKVSAAKIKVADLTEKLANKNEIETVAVRGRNIKTGLPQIINLSKLDIQQALAEPIEQIIDSVKSVLEDTPPELVSDILESGMYLVGGSSQIKGLSNLLGEQTKIEVNKVEKPSRAVVNGNLELLSRPEVLDLIKLKI